MTICTIPRVQSRAQSRANLLPTCHVEDCNMAFLRASSLSSPVQRGKSMMMMRTLDIKILVISSEDKRLFSETALLTHGRQRKSLKATPALSTAGYSSLWIRLTNPKKGNHLGKLKLVSSRITQRLNRRQVQSLTLREAQVGLAETSNTAKEGHLRPMANRAKG